MKNVRLRYCNNYLKLLKSFVKILCVIRLSTYCHGIILFSYTEFNICKLKFNYNIFFNIV